MGLPPPFLFVKLVLMIGIFDSGIGGLTVVKHILEKVPAYPLIYFGDTARVPYGSRSDQIIRRYGLEDALFLEEKGAEIILIACNTISAVATEFLKTKTGVPILDIIQPAVIETIAATKNERIGIIGTLATINSRIHQQQLTGLNPNIDVTYQACPILVSLAEHNQLNHGTVERIVSDHLEPLLRKKVDTIILACTHLPIFTDYFRKLTPKEITLIDPGKALARKLQKQLEGREATIASRGIRHQFFVSDYPQLFEDNFRKFLGFKPGHVEKIELDKLSLK